MKKTLYFAVLMVLCAACSRGVMQTPQTPAVMQTPAWTGVIDIFDTSEEPSYVNLHSASCGGWIPAYEGSSFSIVGTLADGVTVNVYGTAQPPTRYATDGTYCVNEVTASTEIQVVTSGGTPSSSNYTGIVNGQAWPLNFRPNCANTTPNANAPCPYNDRLPDNPATLLANSAAIIQAMNTNGDLEFGLWHNEDAGGMPVYKAASTDPTVKITCTSWCQSSSVSIQIPKNAEASPGICPGDCQMGIIEPNGVEYALYGMSQNYSGGSSITTTGLAFASIVTSSGVDPNGQSLTYPGHGGGDVANGSMFAVVDNSIRVNEINNGTIPHTLHMNLACTTGQVYPGSNAYECSAFGYTGPPAGARFQLTLSDAQIEGTVGNSIGYSASNTAAWERVILHAMHDYGIIGDITCARACGDAMNIYTESSEQYTRFGGTWPVSTFNWASPGNNGSTGNVPTNWRPGGLNWATALRIVDPCYSLETCTQ